MLMTPIRDVAAFEDAAAERQHRYGWGTGLSRATARNA
jgi:hypothetical protein